MQTPSATFGSPTEPEIIRLPLAGRLLRLLNALVDSAVLYLIMFAAFAVLRTLFPENERYTLTNLVMGNGWVWWESILFQAPFSIAYYTIMEVLTGKTVGKMATQTRVVNQEDGGPITWQQGILRSLVRMVPFEFVVYLFTPTGLHDRAGKSLVIDERPSLY